jgi:NAD(P)-dependent dehydrogenase (short-subunit alcohol dehydrogenase family)
MSSSTPSRPRRDLIGKVAIVTGAGTKGDGIGNGRATSILLAEDGALVICVDMDLALAEMTVAMMSQNVDPIKVTVPPQPFAMALQADVTKEEDCQRVVKTALSTYGRVDILVNNVGILGARGTAVELDPAEWARGMEVNVTSMMLMARAAIPVMLQNEKCPNRGVIVNIGSVAGLQGGTAHLLYPTSKGAVVNMTRAMATHHGEDGIRVNCVCPGECSF